MWHPFSFKHQPYAYPLVYIFQVVIGIPGIVVLIGLNILYLSLAILVCQLLDHLTDTLDILHEPKKLKCGNFRIIAKRTNEAYQVVVEKVLRYAVQHHQRTIYFVDTINAIFSNIMLSEILSIALAICIMALQIVNPNVTLERFSSALQIFLLQLSYFCVVCYFAQQIIIKSTERLVCRCYGSVVLNWSAPNQRTARIIGLRADKALQLRAGPFYTLSLSTFKAVLGIAVSFFSFLYKVQRSKS